MSTIADFNRIEDCDKIDAREIDAFMDVTYDEDTDPSHLCIQSSWGGDCIDMGPIVKANETCTTLYLSPDQDPNCLVYEPECGDNICINGDDLSKIISMQHLKDVSDGELVDGAVYVYNSTTQLFEPFDLDNALGNISVTLQNMQASINNLIGRVTTLETKTTPPADAPSGIGLVFGNINLYSDPTAVIDSTTGEATSLDKTHGLYTHLLANEEYADEIFG